MDEKIFRSIPAPVSHSVDLRLLLLISMESLVLVCMTHVYEVFALILRWHQMEQLFCQNLELLNAET